MTEGVQNIKHGASQKSIFETIGFLFACGLRLFRSFLQRKVTTEYNRFIAPVHLYKLYTKRRFL